jgi:hypothetical protein
MLFIEDEQPGVGHRGEDGAPGPHHQPGLARLDPPPLLELLRRRQPAVEHGHRGAEPGHQGFAQLPGQGDFRDEVDDLAPLVEDVAGRLQEDFRLARSGHSLEVEQFIVVGGQGPDGLGLLVG